MGKRILFSFAHPDDESFTVGGLLAKYSKLEGVETIVYSATLGDAGKCGNPPVCSKEELPVVRKKELEKATSILGVDRLITDEFLDGKLQDLPKGVLKEAVAKVIDEYKPEIVVTFPPHGISGHKDHTAIQEATFAAVTQNAQTPVKHLFYVTIAGKEPRMDKIPYVDDIEKVDVITSYTKEEMEKVRQALLAHKTQHLSIDRVFPSIHKEVFKKYGNKEYFIHAWGVDSIKNSKDLFQ